MSRSKSLGLTVFLIILLGFTASIFWVARYYWQDHPFFAWKWRYKVTIEVETPEGVKTGYAVREHSHEPPLFRLPDAGGSSRTIGEAVVVDLGPRGYLFALIPSGKEEFRGAFPYDKTKADRNYKYYSSLKPGTKATLTNKNYWPQMVTFKDLNDPSTAQIVSVDRIEEIFGVGVKIKTITVEIVDAQMASIILRILPWLPDYYSKRLDGSRWGSAKAQLREANSLSAGRFLLRGE